MRFRTKTAIACTVAALGLFAAGCLSSHAVEPAVKDLQSRWGAETPDNGYFAPGPLRVCKQNPRYLEDGSGRVVFLTGSHTWPTMDPKFDWEEFLSFLQRYNHNYIRMWAPMGRTVFWQRTGPGEALDGKPKFDLKKINQQYFDLLRERCIAAGKQGIYVSVMLFADWMHDDKNGTRWKVHPFNPANNINGINGAPDGKDPYLCVHSVDVPETLALQEDIARRTVDAVSDLDNVMFEIINEAGAATVKWQYHMVDFIHEYEKSKPKRHVVGMTYPYDSTRAATNKQLFESNADWISPRKEDDQDYCENPPAADGSKVIVSDTDHLWGIGGHTAWLWKSVCRGMYPIFMDPYRRGSGPAGVIDPQWDMVRKNMGYARMYAERMNLADATPSNDLSSTKCCLTDKKTQFLIFVPIGHRRGVTVSLNDAQGLFNVEWLNIATGEIHTTGTVVGGSRTGLMCPFNGEGVLFIWRGR